MAVDHTGRKIKKIWCGSKRYYREINAFLTTKRQLSKIKNLAASPFRKLPREGHLRGIDFYKEDELIRAMTVTMTMFRKKHGVFPNLVNPVGFNEKIIWSKFFAEFKVPESGNKLLTYTFIPPDIQQVVQCPRIRWHSTRAILPGNDEIPPGYYYLKSNHGSNMFERIRYPLTDDQRAELERQCEQWLSNAFGLNDGEWWYNCFPREILIEDDVTNGSESISINLFIFGGKIESIALHLKSQAAGSMEEKVARLDSDFNYHPEFSRNSTLELPPLSWHIKDEMKLCASKIGEQSRFVRVDFFLGQNEDFYLGEVTFTPNNGMVRRPRKLELHLGEQWIL